MEFPEEWVFDLLAHRGPDDRAVFSDEYLKLIHLRLAVIDIGNGRQPMVSHDGDFIIVYNGELYNFEKLKSELSSEYEFVTRSDTEVLLYSFIKWGPSCLNLLDGIFSFAIYQKSSGLLWICRDPFGVKPLYYYFDQKVLVFASEIKAILPFIESTGLNTQSILNSLFYMYSPTEESWINGVYKLEPGCYMQYDVRRKSLKKQVYYTLPVKNPIISNDPLSKQIDKLEAELLNIVELQLNSDVPLGFLLSGGVDSSLLLAMAMKIKPGNDFTAFTIAPSSQYLNEGFRDDLYYARLVCEIYNVRHEVLEGHAIDFSEIDELAYDLEEPLGDLSPLWVGKISKRAREMGIYVLLSGAGGDDFFSGYRRHQFIYYKKYFKLVPGLAQTLKYFLDNRSVKPPFIRRLMKFVHALPFNLDRLYGWIPFEELKPLLKIGTLLPTEYTHPADVLNKAFESSTAKDELNKLLFLDQKFFLPDLNLNYNDKMSMKHGIELRVPFVSPGISEFSSSLPVEFKMKGSEGKYIVKKLAEKYLPREMIYRKKTGFGGPVRSMFTVESQEKFFKLLDHKDYYFHELFDVERVKDLFYKNITGKIDASYTLLVLLMTESCIRQFYFKPFKSNAGL